MVHLCFFTRDCHFSHLECQVLACAFIVLGPDEHLTGHVGWEQDGDGQVIIVCESITRLKLVVGEGLAVELLVDVEVIEPLEKKMLVILV